MIRILIAEDSPTTTLLLKDLINNNSDMEVIGTAVNGREAVKMAHELKPDVITMDIHMPFMDGYQATRMIMSTTPIPIIVISSSVNKNEMQITFRAIEEGAVAVLEKPVMSGHTDYEKISNQLIRTIQAMSEVKLITRKLVQPVEKQIADQIFTPLITPLDHAFEVVAIGCSTGGPQALSMILATMPADYPLPIVITQHMSSGFIDGMVKWLAGSTLMNVVLAEDQQELQPGTVYFAPDDRHLVIKRNSQGLMVQLNESPPLNGFRPSATPLLESVAQVCGRHSIGIILSGMGQDGVAGLFEIQKVNGHTFVQDQASSVVFGMAAAAIKTGATDEIVALNDIAAHLIELARMETRKERQRH